MLKSALECPAVKFDMDEEGDDSVTVSIIN